MAIIKIYIVIKLPYLSHSDKRFNNYIQKTLPMNGTTKITKVSVTILALFGLVSTADFNFKDDILA